MKLSGHGFVWNIHYPLLPGVPKVYIEGGYSGHQAIPGTYQLTLNYDDNHFETPAIIQANPLYDLSEAQYRAYQFQPGEATVAFPAVGVVARGATCEAAQALGQNGNFRWLPKGAHGKAIEDGLDLIV